MDQDGIAAELIYASVGMGISMHRDARVQGRLHVGLQPLARRRCAPKPPTASSAWRRRRCSSVDEAIADFQRAKDMGIVGMMMPGDPIHEDYDHPDYDALWECATDLELPICFHILTSRAGSMHAETRGPHAEQLPRDHPGHPGRGRADGAGRRVRAPPRPEARRGRERRRLAAALHVPHGPRRPHERRGRHHQGPVEAAERVHPLQRVRHVPGRPDRVPHAQPASPTTTCCGPATSPTPTRRGRSRAS